MSLLTEFENKVGIKSSNLTEELLILIMQDERFSDLFSKPSDVVELMDEIHENISDIEFQKEINTIRHTFNLSHIEKLLSLLFSAKETDEITDEEFKNRLEKNFESFDPLFSISTLVCILVSKYDFPELGEIEYFEAFKSNIAQIENIFISLGRIENSYRYRTEVIDFLYSAREEYFVKFGRDILEDCKWIEREVQVLNDFEDEFIKTDDPMSVNISPNDLGLIDITKLPKE